MSFAEAQTYLDALGIDAMKAMAPSIDRMEAFCAILDDPQRSVPAIHITGTNGKTSTARIASSVLSAAGLSVGTYTSPHLETIRERIARDGVPITEEDLGDVFDRIRPFIELAEARVGERLTYFEILTGMFFLWAAEAPVDAIVVEVGLGGRWDATNVLPAGVGVITNVGFDHTGLLGTDKATIAKEKSGIVKPGSVVVTGERLGEAAAVIAEASEGVGATLVRLGREFDLTDNSTAVGGRYLAIETSDRGYENLFLPLHGAHQGSNAALALEAATRFLPERSLDGEVVAAGFARASVPGRLETLPTGGGSPVILDVAHNPDGMSALVSSLLESFAFDGVVFVVGILADKDLEGMLREMTRLPCRLILTEADSVRSMGVDAMERAAGALGLPGVAEPVVATAVERALEEASEQEIVCVTGSHYVVGQARSYLGSTS